jgi:hypothetical protein
MLTEKDIKSADATARNMYERYRCFQYTAFERATDRAFSYPFDSFGRAYWLAVHDALMVLDNEAKKRRATA